MRALTLIKNAAGCVAVAAMLVLSFPGVEVVRAGEPHAEEAAVCEEPTRAAEVQIRGLEQAVQAAAQVQRPGSLPPGTDEIIVLNNSGYNYRPGQEPVRPPN